MLRGPRQVFAHDAQKGEGAQGGHRARVCARAHQPARGAGGVPGVAQHGPGAGGGRPVLRREPLRGGQAPLLEHFGVGPAREHARAPPPVPAGGGRRASREQHQDVEGGVLRVRRGGRVPIGAALRPQHHRSSGRARGNLRILPVARALRGAHLSHGGRARARARTHGHLHRAWHPLRQVQVGEAHGAPPPLFEQDQHPAPHPHVRGPDALEGARHALRGLRRVRQRRARHDQPLPGCVGARQLQGHLRQGGQRRDLLQEHHVLPRRASEPPQRPPRRAQLAPRPHARRGSHAKGRPPPAHQTLPPHRPAAQPQRRQRGDQRALHRGGGLRRPPQQH
mmetsp:Transcript_12126/g.39864  ORF Transcript_12126/g.39864 Transcript_12126/m.39864 type:complete len:337 (-) Transcript_12126:732-1742(-)